MCGCVVVWERWRRGERQPAVSAHCLISKNAHARSPQPPLYPKQTLHLISTHGTRYAVDETRQNKLQSLLNQGRHHIREFVSKNLSALVSSGGDEFDQAAFEAVSTVK